MNGENEFRWRKHSLVFLSKQIAYFDILVLSGCNLDRQGLF